MRGLFAISVIGSWGCNHLLGIEDFAIVDGATDSVTVDAVMPDSAMPPQNFHLRIEAQIDGLSHLVVKGTTVHWNHMMFVAPGRNMGANDPTTLNGVDWFPMWPDIPDAENRDCNCLSSTTQLLVGVPRVASTTMLSEIQVRRPQAIVQHPAPNNDYELIVELNDVGFGGYTKIILDVDVTVNP